MKICLLGGTGAIGTYLQHLLADENHEVFVSSRNANKRDGGHIHFLCGNAKDLSFISALDDDYDAIVDFMSYKTEEFKQRVGLLLGKTKHYVFLSSARVFANSKVIVEDSPRLLDVTLDKEYLATDEYALTKARQEDVLTSIGGGKNYTIVRPYITYGNKRLQLSVLEKEEWLHRALTNRSIVFCKELAEKKTTLTSGYDVAKAIKKILEKGAAGEIYNLTNDYTVTWQEILDIYMEELTKYLGVAPRISWITLDEFVKLFRPIPSQYQVTVDRVFDRVFDNKKLLKLMDTGDFVHPQQGLRECISYFLQHKHFRHINWRESAKIDREVRERIPIYKIKGVKIKLDMY